MTEPLLRRWLDGLPAAGWKGTSTQLRQALAGCLAPGDVLPGSRSVVRKLAAALAETKYVLRHRRLTRARLLLIEHRTTPGDADLRGGVSRESPPTGADTLAAEGVAA